MPEGPERLSPQMNAVDWVVGVVGVVGVVTIVGVVLDSLHSQSMQ